MGGADEEGGSSSQGPSTAALVSSAEVIKSLDGYFEEKSPFEDYILTSCGALAAKKEIRTLLKMLL